MCRRANFLATWRPVPSGTTNLVERLGGPRHDMERISATDRLRGVGSSDTASIQLAPSAETCVNAAERCGPSSTKNRASVG